MVILAGMCLLCVWVRVVESCWGCKEVRSRGVREEGDVGW